MWMRHPALFTQLFAPVVRGYAEAWASVAQGAPPAPRSEDWHRLPLVEREG